MLVTRKTEFSASHVCRHPALSEQENLEIYGQEASPNGHGHNYVLEVSVEGSPDPITGMVMDLKDLKIILEEEIVTPMDHRFLNREVEPFTTVVPTAENIAREIWRRLAQRLSSPEIRLAKVRLFETNDLYVDVTQGDFGIE